MGADVLAKREPVTALLTTLHSKFAANLVALEPEVIQLIEIIDLKSRAIDGASVELQRIHFTSDAHKLQCAFLIQEVFADLCQAMYLLAIGLVVPARMSTRRALELGVAVLYMWDLPHEYWAWAKHDEDLSFSKMVDHLGSPGYISLIAATSPPPVRLLQVREPEASGAKNILAFCLSFYAV